MSVRKEEIVSICRWCGEHLHCCFLVAGAGVTLCSLLGYTPLLRQACVESGQKSTAVARLVSSALIPHAVLCSVYVRDPTGDCF